MSRSSNSAGNEGNVRDVDSSARTHVRLDGNTRDLSIAGQAEGRHGDGDKAPLANGDGSWERDNVSNNGGGGSVAVDLHGDGASGNSVGSSVHVKLNGVV